MPIDKIILEKIATNNPDCTTLDLSYQGLVIEDIKALCEALEQNTILKTLDLTGNLLEEQAANLLVQNKTLTSLIVAGNRIGNAGAEILAKNKTLRLLDLSYNAITSSGVKAFSQNDTLTSLLLTGNRVDCDGASELAKNNTLTTLMLTDNHVNHIGAIALGRNRTLTTVGLGGNRIGDVGAIGIAQNTTSLTWLDISRNQISLNGVKALIGNQLRYLNISYNQIGMLGAQELSKSTTFDSLIIAGNQINNEGIKALARIPNLVLLDLSYNQINDDGLQGVTELAQHPRLMRLDLSYNQIGSAGALALAGNTKLAWLGLSYNFIGDTGAQALSKHPTLTYLDVSANQISFQGAHALAQNKILKILKINYNTIGDAGAVTFALTRNNSLVELALCYNNIGDAGALSLAENLTLRQLNLHYNPIGNEGRNALAKSKALVKPLLPAVYTPENIPDFKSITFLLAQDLLCLCGVDGTIQFFNPAFPRILGYSTDELLGKKITHYLHPDDRIVGNDILEKVSKFPYIFELRFLCQDLSYRTFRWSAQVKYEHIYLVGSDLSEQRKYEQIVAKVEKQRVETRLQEAAIYNQKQMEFISYLCHEIRNPLNGLFGINDLIKNRLSNIRDLIENPSEEALPTLQNKLRENVLAIENALNESEVCAEYQKSILDNNLDISKINENNFTLACVPLDIKKIIYETIIMLRATASQKGLTIETKMPEEDIFVKGDEMRLKQIIINLVGNAVKSTKKGGIVIILMAEQQSNFYIKCRLDIADSGVGLAKEEIDQLFMRFSSLGSSMSAHADYVQGSGLGLYLTKSLVNLMSGDIIVESEKGVGSTFSCIIPFAKPSEQEIYQLKEKERLQVPKNKRSRSPREPNKWVALIADDNVINQKVLSSYLVKAGYEVIVVENGLEAFNRYTSSSLVPKIDIILMDILMPVMSGLSATQKIRQFEQEQGGLHVPIIAVSGQVSEEEKRKAIAAGMDSFISKPFKKEDILHEMDRLLTERSEKETSEPDSKYRKIEEQVEQESSALFHKSPPATDIQFSQFFPSISTSPLAALQQWLQSVASQGTWTLERDAQSLFIAFNPHTKDIPFITVLTQLCAHLGQFPEWKKVVMQRQDGNALVVRMQNEEDARQCEELLKGILGINEFKFSESCVIS